MKSLYGQAAALICTMMLLIPAAAITQTESWEPNLKSLSEGKEWTVQYRKVRPVDDGAKSFVHFDEAPGVGFAWVEQDGFSEGVIEIDLRGRNIPQRSFIGVAFHEINDTTYEAIYFRPFNFMAADSLARTHAVQYICPSAFDWRTLRTTHPGMFEQPLASPPDPDGWFHARIVVTGTTVSVYVNDAVQPSLEVKRLRDSNSGKIGLWVGDNSGGDFTNFRFTRAK